MRLPVFYLVLSTIDMLPADDLVITTLTVGQVLGAKCQSSNNVINQALPTALGGAAKLGRE